MDLIDGQGGPAYQHEKRRQQQAWPRNVPFQIRLNKRRADSCPAERLVEVVATLRS
jgi:hypothetical protein